MSEKLLPCPFCGGEAEIALGQSDFDGAEIFCVKCSASCGHFENDPMAEKAIAAWNTRTTQQQPVGEALALARKALESVKSHKVGGEYVGLSSAKTLVDDALLTINATPAQETISREKAVEIVGSVLDKSTVRGSKANTIITALAPYLRMEG